MYVQPPGWPNRSARQQPPHTLYNMYRTLGYVSRRPPRGEQDFLLEPLQFTEGKVPVSAMMKFTALYGSRTLIAWLPPVAAVRQLIVSG